MHPSLTCRDIVTACPRWGLCHYCGSPHPAKSLRRSGQVAGSLGMVGVEGCPEEGAAKTQAFSLRFPLGPEAPGSSGVTSAAGWAPGPD